MLNANRLGIGRSQVRLALLLLVLGTGAVLRVLALGALPDFFAPGEPATYFAMAQGVLHGGIPRVGFIWNFASAPAAISHVEDYANPAFAYLLAAVMAAFGDGAFVARTFATACGVLAPVLTYVFTRRLGAGVAIVAAAIVALDPWAIYYSGVLMEETLVAVVLLVAVEALRRVLQAGGSARGTGLAAAAIVGAAGAFQCELLPILACAAALTVLAARRDALPAFLVALAIVVASAVGVTWLGLGVPLSGKLWAFLGRSLWTPETGARAARVSSSGPARFLPFVYIARALLLKWYVCIPVLAWIGSRSNRLARVDVALPLSLMGSFLYFHGVPHDLWERDFIPLVPILAPFVALAVCKPVRWATPIGRGLSGPSRRDPGLEAGDAPDAPESSRRAGWRALPRGPFALGLIAGAALGTWVAIALIIVGRLPVRSMPWPVIGCSAAASLLLTALLLPLSTFLDRPFVRRALPVLGLGIVFASFSQSLPWPSIMSNPEFPAFEARRVACEHACGVLGRSVPAAAVMTSAPAEVHLYSGFPAVLLPITHNPGAILEVRRRYGVRYLFTLEKELDRSTIANLALQAVVRFQGRVVYVFPGDALIRGAAPRGVPPPERLPSTAPTPAETGVGARGPQPPGPSVRITE